VRLHTVRPCSQFQAEPLPRSQFLSAGSEQIVGNPEDGVETLALGIGCAPHDLTNLPAHLLLGAADTQH